MNKILRSHRLWGTQWALRLRENNWPKFSVGLGFVLEFKNCQHASPAVLLSHLTLHFPTCSFSAHPLHSSGLVNVASVGNLFYNIHTHFRFFMSLILACSFTGTAWDSGTEFAFLFFSIHFLLMTINSTDYNFFTHCWIIFTCKVQSRLACFQKSGEIWWCTWIEEGAGSWRYQRSSKVLLYLKAGTLQMFHWFWMQGTASFVVRKVDPVPGLL